MLSATRRYQPVLYHIFRLIAWSFDIRKCAGIGQPVVVIFKRWSDANTGTIRTWTLNGFCSCMDMDAP